jgi:ABC-type oligopeptide transport system substrate-binding subunit
MSAGAMEGRDMGTTRSSGSDYRDALREPELLARLERTMRSTGVSRRAFLAFATTVAGTAALAACGGGTAPTATSAPTTAAAPTTAPTAAAAATVAAPATSAAPAAVAPSVAPTSVPAPAATVASGAAATGPESKKLYIHYITAEPISHDVNQNIFCGGVIPMHAGLLQYDPDFAILPDLAESYAINGATYTFKIRQGATWSDGQPVRAQDFVYSIRRLVDPRTNNPYKAYWDNVIKGAIDLSRLPRDAPNLDQVAQGIGVRAVDDRTLEIAGDAFAALIVPQLASWASSPAREDIVKKYTDSGGVSSWTDPNKTGGPVLASGAYQITAWKHNQQVDLVRNDKYWNAKNIRQKYVTVKVITDLARSSLAYENGDIDIQPIPAADVARFQSDPKLKAQTFAFANPFIRFLVADTGHPPFDKIEVRKAVTYAVDKDRLVNQVGKKVNLVAYAMTSPGVVGYFDDGDNKLKDLQKYDPKAAMDALKGTTFEGGRNWPKITLSYNSSDTDIPAGYPDEIARQLKENIGMDVQLEPLDGKVFDARRFTLDLQFILYRWAQDYPDPHAAYYLTWGIHTKGSARQSYTDPVFDDLMKRGATETDLQKRLAIYYQAEVQLLSQFAYLPIHWRIDYYGIKPWVTGIPKNKQGYIVPNNALFVRQWDRISVTDDSPHDPPK